MQRNHHQPASAEDRIIRAALDGVVAAGYQVAVWNGEDWSSGPSADVDAFLGSLRATDADTLHLVRDGAATSSWVLLVYGNDPCEVMADWTVDIDELLLPAVTLADAIEAAEATRRTR